MSTFWIFAFCAFSSGFALRIADPIVLPVALHFHIDPKLSALLSTAYALPYALSQPFLGPIGDRFGKLRCIQFCVLALGIALALGTVAPNFYWLFATRIIAGAFAGGLIPLVLASIGDRYGMEDRQAMIGRMLFATIGGQMAGSAASGLIDETLGWRAVLAAAAFVALFAAYWAWFGVSREASQAPMAARASSFRALYAQVFANPRAPWLFGAVMLEGILAFGLFPYFGERLVQLSGRTREAISAETGIVLGAFGIGGLFYAFTVRRLVSSLGPRRMTVVGGIGMAACYALLMLLHDWRAIALVMLLSGYALYMVHNSLQTQATELAPGARGSAVALFAAGLFTGQGLGPMLLGQVVHHAGFVAALGMVAAGFVLLAVVIPRRVVIEKKL